MKENNLADFDLSISYDKNNLQEIPNNPDSYYKGILHFKKAAINEKDKLKKSKILSRIGVMYRIHGDNLKSEKYLLSALNIIDKSKHKSYYVIATLRLAHTYQKQKKFNLSNRLFKELEVMCNENENLKDFLDYVYQHTGKLKFDMKRYEEAYWYFEKAFKLREAKGDKELLSSTDFAIQITKNKLKK
ncbi:MAG: tetratricopeptide repeat protein [bacterium]